MQNQTNVFLKNHRTDIEIFDAATANALCFHSYCGRVRQNGRTKPIIKDRPEVKAILKNDAIAAPVDVIREHFSGNVLETDGVYTVSLADKCLTLRTDSASCTNNGREMSLSVAPFTENGLLYVSLTEVMTHLGIPNETFDGLFIAGRADFKTLRKTPDAVAAGAYAVCSVSFPKSTSEKDFKAARDRWRSLLVGDKKDYTSGGLVQQVIRSVELKGRSAQESLNRSNDAASLFGSMAVETTEDMTRQYEYLNDMVKAYGTYGTSLYKNEKLKKDILFGLEYLYRHFYGEAEIHNNGWRDTSLFNWWDWFVGVPAQLTSVLMILHDEMEQEQIKKYLSPFDHFRSTQRLSDNCAPSRLLGETAAGLLENDTASLVNGVRDFNLTMQKTDIEPGKDGLKEDWNYISHYYFPYAGGYGAEILAERAMFAYSALWGTKFEIKSPNIHNIVMSFYHTFEPILYGGGLMSTFTGRRSVDEQGNGKLLISILLNLIECFGNENNTRLAHMIKRNVTEANLPFILEGLSLKQAAVLESILADPEISSKNDYQTMRVYYTGDRAVQQRNRYAVAVAMNSERIASYECINDENIDGWYGSDGAIYLYTDRDEKQYSRSFWNERNPYHIPGTTAETQKREAVSIDATEVYRSHQDFVGGVELEGQYATAAMSLESFHNNTSSGMKNMGYGGSLPIHHSDLTAKKAYFMLDYKIICLGSGICASDGFEVQTIIENRMLTKEENAKPLSDSTALSREHGQKTIRYGTTGTDINGILLPETEDYEHRIEGVSWLNVENVGGYYFPDEGAVNVRKTQNGNRYFEAWLSHGINPKSDKYAYIMLPTMTETETAAYAQKPDVTVLVNNEEQQAVKDSSSKTLGIVFWKAGTVAGITADAPMLCMMMETDTEYILSVSDPTHKLRTAKLSIEHTTELLSCDNRMCAASSSAETKITIDFEGSHGKTLTAKFRKEESYKG